MAIPATVKFTAGPPRETQRGPRINVLVNSQQGEYRIWGEPGDVRLTTLSRGQQILIEPNSDGKSAILATATQQPIPTANGYQSPPQQQGQQYQPAPAAAPANPIAPAAPPDKSKRLAELQADWVCIFLGLHEELSGVLTPAEIVPVATTIFIQSCRG